LESLEGILKAAIGRLESLEEIGEIGELGREIEGCHL
jgi:hypothetical protein